MSGIITESGNPAAETVSLTDDGRVPAPDIKVDDFGQFRINERSEIIDRLDDANPEFKHCYAKSTWDDVEYERRGLERVEGEHHFSDPVARMSRVTYDKRREVERAYSAQTVERVVDPENDIYQQERIKPPHRQRRRMP